MRPTLTEIYRRHTCFCHKIEDWNAWTGLRALISSPEAWLGNKLIKMFGMMPRIVAAPLWKATAFKTTLSMSNVPGPQFPLAFLGEKVDRMYFFVPPMGTVGFFLTIFSFDNKVTISLSADATLLDKGKASVICARYFKEELEAMEQLFGN
jgi:hypothetical protein